MASTLPNNPSLDRLRDDARRLQRGVTATDRQALEIVRRHHPRPDIALAGAPDRFALHDAQLIVARGYGFTGWPALVHYLEIAAVFKGVHPESGDYVEYESEYPDDLQHALDVIRDLD